MNTNTIALTPCPFCGKSDTLVIGKASDVFAEPDECGDPMPYMHTESYAVTCDASKPDGPGGCGASGGYKLTEAEAVSAWNERAAIAALEAEPQPIDAIKAERRAIMYGDIVHNHVCAMRAAVVASHLESPEAGMRWIVNTLFGPGHLPDVDEAIELGGAQAMFDKEMAEHEAFRAAHPAPTLPATPPKD